jgi:hypothetical protein
MNIDSIEASISNPFSSPVRQGKLRGKDFHNGFQIVEYINGVAQDDLSGNDTSIAWQGTNMPFQPMPWDIEQRLVKEYYPGNREPVVQVLGAKDGPLDIKGRFKDKRLDKTINGMDMYGTAYQYNLEIKEMIVRGNLVKFGVHGPGGVADLSWIRWGFLEKGSFKMNKLSWIDYDITFCVVSETQPINNYFTGPEKIAPGSANQNMINAASDFMSTYSSVPSSLPLSVAGKINNLISSISSVINTVTGFVSNVIATAQSIEDSANRALGMIKNLKAEISIFQRSIGNLGITPGLPNSFTSLSSQGAPAGTVTDAYRNLSYGAETSMAMSNMNQYLTQMEAIFSAMSITVPLSRYRVQQGNTLQNISIKFYGTASNASAIAEHNNLTSNTLTVGSVLEIPKL